MQEKYMVKKYYPGLMFPMDTVLYKYSPIVGFSYYSDDKDKYRLKIIDVENNPEWFEKI